MFSVYKGQLSHSHTPCNRHDVWRVIYMYILLWKNNAKINTKCNILRFVVFFYNSVLGDVPPPIIITTIFFARSYVCKGSKFSRGRSVENWAKISKYLWSHMPPPIFLHQIIVLDKNDHLGAKNPIEFRFFCNFITRA